MGQQESGYYQWTEKDLVRETISNFESLEGVDFVEWVTTPSNANVYDLVKVHTRAGKVRRLAITSYTDYGSDWIFDDSFDESAR